jgi:hypothetical protein
MASRGMERLIRRSQVTESYASLAMMDVHLTVSREVLPALPRASK